MPVSDVIAIADPHRGHATEQSAAEPQPKGNGTAYRDALSRSIPNAKAEAAAAASPAPAPIPPTDDRGTNGELKRVGGSAPVTTGIDPVNPSVSDVPSVSTEPSRGRTNFSPADANPDTESSRSTPGVPTSARPGVTAAAAGTQIRTLANAHRMPSRPGNPAAESAAEPAATADSETPTPPPGLVRALAVVGEHAGAQPVPGAAASRSDEPVLPPRGFFPRPTESHPAAPAAAALPPAGLQTARDAIAAGDSAASEQTAAAAANLGSMPGASAAGAGLEFERLTLAVNRVMADASERPGTVVAPLASPPSKAPAETLVPEAPPPESNGRKERTLAVPPSKPSSAAAASDHVRPADTPAPPEIVDRAEIVQRVVDLAQRSAEHSRPFRVRLHPPELGALQVEIVREGNTVSARMQVETVSAMNALTRHLSDLRHSLSRHGVTVDRVEVQLVDFRTTGESQQQSDADADQQGGSFAQDDHGHRGGDTEDAREQPPRRKPEDRLKRSAGTVPSTRDQVDVQI
jgi:hypothetical protein